MAGNVMDKQYRTSKEQIDCYLSLVQSHPRIRQNKNDPTNPKRMEELWAELAEHLNALRGPTRTPAKWKESLNHWKNQVRSRARKNKANRLVTGGGPLVEEDVSESEQRALNAIGTTVVLGEPGVPTIGTETEIVITCDPLSPPVEFDEPIIETPSPSCHPFSPPGEVHDAIVGTPTTSRRRNKSSSTSEEMFSKMMESIQRRNEAEQLFRQESLNCMTEFCAAMNNMANAVLSLTRSQINN
ncbi:uncharacterized protein [Eurosta solidaginis]|uniref:uncharacterized protein isoform X2 n=1 Tax=Eurosta solidaginis TaxID=178769 RepID=UPI0035307096